MTLLAGENATVNNDYAFTVDAGFVETTSLPVVVKLGKFYTSSFVSNKYGNSVTSFNRPGLTNAIAGSEVLAQGAGAYYTVPAIPWEAKLAVEFVAPRGAQTSFATKSDLLNARLDNVIKLPSSLSLALGAQTLSTKSAADLKKKYVASSYNASLSWMPEASNYGVSVGAEMIRSEDKGQTVAANMKKDADVIFGSVKLCPQTYALVRHEKNKYLTTEGTSSIKQERLTFGLNHSLSSTTILQAQYESDKNGLKEKTIYVGATFAIGTAL